MIIAIDGPAASGKSTTAHGVAQRLGFRHIDTGAMYRAVTLHMVQEDVPLDDIGAIQRVLEKMQMTVTFEEGEQVIYLNGRRLGDEIRSPEITDKVAEVSAIGDVRKRLLSVQREVAAAHDVVLEGRDIGTVVFPEAEVKIYMIADSRIRAERRRKEFARQGITKSLDELEEEIIARDRHNARRILAPMKPAKDAIILDTTNLSIEGQIDFIVSMIEKEKSNGGN